MIRLLGRTVFHPLAAALLVGLCAAGSASGAHASESFYDLVRLAQAGANADDMIDYVQHASGHFNLSEHERTVLADLGVDDKVFDAINEHNRALTSTQVEPVYVAPSAAQPDDLQWDAEAAVPDGDTVNQDVFYRTLSPYGTWFDSGGQWVWRPTVAIVDPHWRPYCHRGHWVLTEHGWTWASDYSWGWAPFHYGRWHRHPEYGWVWTPGLDWGPGWVVWRSGDSDCGWAPMPPTVGFRQGVGIEFTAGGVDFGLGVSDFVFVPVAKLFEPRWWDFRHHRDAKREVFARSPLAHTHLEISGNLIINRGLEISFVERLWGHPVTRFEIARPSWKAGEHFRPALMEGNKVFFFRPTVRPAVTVLPAAIVHEREERFKQFEVARDNRFSKAQVELRVKANERHEALVKEMEAVQERQKQREATAEASRLRNDRLAKEAEVKRIDVIRKESDNRAERDQLQRAEEDRKRQFEAAKARDALAAREAEQRRKEAEAAEQKRAADAIEAQRRAQDDARRKQDAERTAQQERLKQLQDQQRKAAEAQQRADAEKQQAELRKQMDAQRAAQAEAQRRADEQRKAMEAEAKARIDASRRADEQRAQQEKALEQARRDAAARSAERERQAIREEHAPQRAAPPPPAPAPAPQPAARDDRNQKDDGRKDGDGRKGR